MTRDSAPVPRDEATSPVVLSEGGNVDNALWRVVSLRTGMSYLARGTAQGPLRSPQEKYGPYRLEQLDVSTPARRLEVLAALLQSMPAAWRTRWCSSQLCGCLGAANCSGQLAAAGFTRDEWESALRAQGAGSCEGESP